MVGGVAGALRSTVVAPLERTRMIMNTEGKAAGTMTDVLKKQYAQGGWRSYWQGNWINCLRLAPNSGLAFFFKDYFKQRMGGDKASPLGIASASAMSGIVCVAGTYPIDIVRARVTVSPGEYRMGISGGLVDGLTQMAKKEGILSWFNGVNAVVPWGAMYYGSQFFTYDMIKQTYSTYGMPEGEKREMNPALGIPFGATASVVSTTFAFPLECVRRKLQSQGFGGRPILYDGLVDCFKKVVKAEGVGGLYNGCKANNIKGVFAVPVTFLFVESLQWTFKLGSYSNR